MKVRTNVIFKINSYENGSIAVKAYVFLFLCPTYNSAVFQTVFFLGLDSLLDAQRCTLFNIHRSVHRNIFLQYNQQDAPVISN